MERYTRLGRLAQCHEHGEVALLRDKRSNELCVIKISRNSSPDMDIMKVLQCKFGGHPNIIRYIDGFVIPKAHCTVMEHCPKGDLLDYVKKKHLLLPRSQSLDVFKQIVSGVHFMHLNGYAHRDLSLENVLLTETNECKLIDFRSAISSDAFTNARVGKRGYMAPEVYRQFNYDPLAADLWSLGIIFHILLLGSPPFEKPKGRRFDFLTTCGLRAFIHLLYPQAQLCEAELKILGGLLQREPTQRMGVREVIQTLRRIRIEAKEKDTGFRRIFRKLSSRTFKKSVTSTVVESDK